ncbi:hypothetical protein NE237_000581 [Protea cynaroides]|uniref:VWFA domain-containing protein n=1 Tax=Protea cynaroides TaxID=273540 RepID=A0A9Q0QXA0_9MAGN|nr:hypothetical protein NE237_000581 [Protea cynaroides]
MEPTSRDENSILSMDENEIRKTHAPDGKKVDVRLLYKLINTTLMPSATSIVERDHHRVVDANPLIKIYKKLKGFMGDHVNPLLHSLHLNRFNNSSDQELAKTVHKIYLELSCKCSKGKAGDVNSETVALFKKLSNYSWEVKMVLAFAGFAVVYGESAVKADQTDPLAESIKLMKKSPDQSILWKIHNLIDAIVKVTNTVVKIGDSQPENIETVVSWTVKSIVFCTSHITGSLGLDVRDDNKDDDDDDDDLTQLTKKIVEMNRKLLAKEKIKPTRELIIDVNAIQSTHAPDGENLELGPLHEFINQILMYKSSSSTSSTAAEEEAPRYRVRDILLVVAYLVILLLTGLLYARYHWNWIFTCWLCFWVLISFYTGQLVRANPMIKLCKELFEGTTGNHPPENDVLEDQLQTFRNSTERYLEDLTDPVQKIFDELSCKCLGEGDANSKTVALFNTLSQYSWEAKMILALAAFSIMYGESLLMANLTNPFVGSIKLLKQVPDKSKLSKIRSFIAAMVKVTDTIVEVVKVNEPQPENISTLIQTIVSWTVGSLIVCTSQIIGLDEEYTDDELLKLTKTVNGMNTQVGQELDTWRQSIEEEAKRKAEEEIKRKAIEEAKRKAKEEAEKKAKEIQEKVNQMMQNIPTDSDNGTILNSIPLPENKEQVATNLRHAGLESSNLIIGMDFSASNGGNGKKTFQGRSLHDIRGSPNPYQQAIDIIGNTLAPFTKNNKIHCYGFGDATTGGDYVFSFHSDLTPCQSFEEVLMCYKKIAQNVELSGPTLFAPIVDAAIDIVEKSGGQHHVLVIIADDWIRHEVEKKSIITASGYALSIVYVGVGDESWDKMKGFSDKIRGRQFDNFQFVDFNDIMTRYEKQSEKEAAFSLVSTMKIPKQYKAAKEHGFLNHKTGRQSKVVPIPPSFMR